MHDYFFSCLNKYLFACVVLGLDWNRLEFTSIGATSVVVRRQHPVSSTHHSLFYLVCVCVRWHVFFVLISNKFNMPFKGKKT